MSGETQGAPKPAVERTLGEAPEWWVERPPVPPSAEYIRFQIVVAKRIAEKTGTTFLKALRRYTPCIEGFEEGTIPDRLNHLSVDELTKDLTFQHRKKPEMQRTAPYHPEGSFRFGCFTYEYDPEEQAVRIHFQNDERGDTGPLTEEKIARRKEELHDVFTSVKKLYPDAKTVRGNSWLYNLQAYRRLFPENYTAHLTPETSPRIFGRGEWLWGQFSDHKRGIKSDDVRREFIQNLYLLDTIDDESFLALFPLKPLKAEGPIEDFYALYGVK